LADKTKVLYIEDNKDQADLVVTVLEYRLGDVEVRIASDGKEGIRKALEWEPDLILLDLMMPRTDGIEVIHQIRHDPKIGKTPIVVISAWVGPGSQMSRVVEKAGADAFFSKPVEANQLVNIVARYARQQ
jgi:two-component system sensor histidine kinase ChiS